MLSYYPHYIPLYPHNIYIYTYVCVCVPLYLHYSMFYAIPMKSHYIPMTSYHISIISHKKKLVTSPSYKKYQISPTMCVEATKTQVFGSDSAGGIRMHAGCHRSPFRGQGQSSHATATGLDPGAAFVAFVAFVARSRKGCV